MFEDARARASGATAHGRVEPVNASPRTIAGLFESEESALLYYSMAIVKRRIVAEELVQEAFLKLQRIWGQVDNPRGWLYRSVRNLSLNHIREARHETSLDEERASQEECLPRELMGRSEAIGAVRMLLAEMPDEDRSLITLKYNEGLKYQEISLRTGLSVGNVGLRLHHALKRLLDGLRRAGIEGSEG